MSGIKDKPRPGPPQDILAFVNHLDHQGAQMKSTTVVVKDQAVHRLDSSINNAYTFSCLLFLIVF